ncbi:hypothetical protein AWC38_SpisGene2322 [Stylophora pistillata]|uniref:Uncharacterized protein n=1 Tax=Stylophora pistillata TaxID=50429 RepID=A0A2B4SW99_STYPI|nr:hypothetical protein AWC38_SpisGene2322 [Stylophora pistillata]
MSVMLTFLIAMMISTSTLALDEKNGKKHKEDAGNPPELQYLHQRPKPACICGITSVKCCRKGRMFSKMGFGELQAYARNGRRFRE